MSDRTPETVATPSRSPHRVDALVQACVACQVENVIDDAQVTLLRGPQIYLRLPAGAQPSDGFLATYGHSWGRACRYSGGAVEAIPCKNSLIALNEPSQSKRKASANNVSRSAVPSGSLTYRASSQTTVLSVSVFFR